MTITVKYKTISRRFAQNMVFNSDVDDSGSIIFDYAGELGADTISTATATTQDITAGTPSITNNVVTVALSAGKEGIAKMELKITTAGGNTLSSVVRFRVTDNYNA